MKKDYVLIDSVRYCPCMSVFSYKFHADIESRLKSLFEKDLLVEKSLCSENTGVIDLCP